MPFIKPLGDTLDGNLTTTDKTFTGAISYRIASGTLTEIIVTRLQHNVIW